MSYQTFTPNEKSNSDSFGKFNSLKLSKEQIENKNVVDIGCNEGYFCFKLKQLGAEKVIGIDKSQKYIELAKKRDINSDIIFINDDYHYLDSIAENSIDMVLLLSAMHYMSHPEHRDEKDIPEIIYMIHRVLKPEGVFIFEGGVYKDNDSNEFIQLKRKIGDTVYHPTENKLLNILTSIFSKYQYIGNSVNQGGDPVPRYVYMGIK